MSSLERRIAAFERRFIEDNGNGAGHGRDAESDGEDEDKIWLRSGQTATYPPTFIRPDEKEDALFSEKLIKHSEGQRATQGSLRAPEMGKRPLDPDRNCRSVNRRGAHQSCPALPEERAKEGRVR